MNKIGNTKERRNVFQKRMKDEKISGECVVSTLPVVSLAEAHNL